MTTTADADLLARHNLTADEDAPIRTPGRYVNALRARLRLAGDVVLVNDVAPGFSPVDLVERGQWARVGRFVPLDDYAPLALPEASAELVTCFIGLHHAPPERLSAFVASIARVLRPGGVFILRDHDVTSPAMDAFVSLAHTVFNAGLGLPWAENRKERRHFAPIAEWSRRMQAAGLIDDGRRLAQLNDPSDNLLLAFTKPAPGAPS